MKKKLVSLMLVAAMTASLTACGSKKTEEPTSTVHKSITAAEYDAAITSDAAIYKKAFTMPEYKGIQDDEEKRGPDQHFPRAGGGRESFGAGVEIRGDLGSRTGRFRE